MYTTNLSSESADVAKITTRHLSLSLHGFTVLSDVNLMIPEKSVTALIGASGCGKSLFLRCINRLAEEVDQGRISGEIWMSGMNLLSQEVEPLWLRRRVGMLLGRPAPFLKSIYDNVAYGPRLHGLARSRQQLDEIVYQSLTRVGLWDVVKDRLRVLATTLPLAQQQLVCLARVLATNPDVLLMDEPCTLLDPIATAEFEELVDGLKSDITVLMVTHNLQQAARASQWTAFFHRGKLIEMNRTVDLFTNPVDSLTLSYITGRLA